MGGINREKADAIMAKIGYVRGLEFEPNTDKWECWYSYKDPAQFSICIRIRLHDAGFQFSYIQGLETMTRLYTDWFSPVTKKSHFVKWYKQFLDDAMWFAKKYSGGDMDWETVVGDMVTLIDGAMKEFMPDDWFDMDEKEKKRWCADFGMEHAHVIKHDE